MVKAYLRYEPGPVLGAISAGPGLAYASPDGGLLASGAGESVALWDARTGARVRTLTPARSENTGEVAGEVTILAAGPATVEDGNAAAAAGVGGGLPSTPPRGPLASGHSDGRVRLWDWGTGACDAALAGHSGPITALAWGPPAGGLLASGGADTDIVLWDASAEAGLFRLRGHVGQVTGLAFLRDGRGLASCSKDGHVRVWDLAARACVQTLAVASAGGGGSHPSASDAAAASGELWALAVDPAGDRVAVAGSGGEVVVYRVEDAEGLAAAAAAAGVAAVSAAGGGAPGAAAPGAAAGAAPPTLTPHGTLRRSAPERATALAWTALERGAAGSLLACAAAGRAVEVWVERPPGDARKHAARRAKRRREKAAKDGRGGDTAAAAATADTISPALIAPDAADEMEGRPALRPKARVRALAARPPPSTSASADPGRGGGGHHHARRRALGRLALGLATNVLEQWDVPAEGGGSGGGGGAGEGGDLQPGAAAAALATPDRVSTIEAPGHRTGVRAVALSSDARLLAAASGTVLKLWSMGGGEGTGLGGSVLRTADLGGTGLAALFAPGDRHVVVGTKEGGVCLVDVATGGVRWVGGGGGGGGEEEEEEEGGEGGEPPARAHAGPVWSLASLPDGSGFVSASADHDLKLWEWEVVSVPGSTAAAAPRLGARHVRTLRLADDALAVRLTPDGRLLAVSLLDSTIQVFHTDTLKFALALYGHSLPALALDIASDGVLLASGGADKAVRLWGLDFGDCHRALRGHGDAVMALAFVPGTHYLFSASKDRTVRYWDADRWEALLTLDGHTGEVWCLAAVPPPPGMSSSSIPPGWGGGLVVSGSADRTLRAWTRTDEPFFVEEERERRLESLFDAGAAEAAGRADGAAAATAALTGDLPADGSSAAAASLRATGQALTSADALAEALAAADVEDERVALDAEEAVEAAAAGRPPPRPTAPSPLLLGLSPDAAVLRALRGVRPSDLESALLALPPADAARLLRRLRRLADGSAVLPAGGLASALLPPSSSPELLVRAAALLARVHAPALAGSAGVASELAALRAPLRKRAAAARDALAGVEAALEHLLRVAKARKAVS